MLGRFFFLNGFDNKNTLSLTELTVTSPPAPVGPSPFPSPVGRGVKCEVTPTGLLVWGVGSLFFYAGYFFLSQSAQS